MQELLAADIAARADGGPEAAGAWVAAQVGLGEEDEVGAAGGGVVGGAGEGRESGGGGGEGAGLGGGEGDFGHFAGWSSVADTG